MLLPCPLPRTPPTAATKQQCLVQGLLEPSPTFDQLHSGISHSGSLKTLTILNNDKQQPGSKMGKGREQTFLGRRPTNGRSTSLAIRERKP